MSNITLNPSQSAYVSYGAPNNNYNANDYLRCGIQSSIAIRYMTLVQFNLSSIPAHSIINSAALKLYSYSNLCYNALTTQLAKRCTGSWVYSTVTYNTKPATTDTNQASMTNSGYDKWYEWNIKDIAQLWSNGTANYGLWIIQADLDTTEGKCYKRTGTYVPQLAIDYTPVGMQAKVSGVWENCLAHAKSGGDWKMCQSYIKDSGTWKEAK